MRTLFTLLFVCFISFAQSQSLELKGKIVDIKTKEPLPFASVYFNKTTNGVDTDENGKFEIKVNPAFRELVISYLGYNTLSYQLDLSALDQPFTFELEPNNQLDEVEVVLKRGDNWYLDLERFKLNFLGYSEFAMKSKILCSGSAKARQID